MELLERGQRFSIEDKLGVKSFSLSFKCSEDINTKAFELIPLVFSKDGLEIKKSKLQVIKQLKNDNRFNLQFYVNLSEIDQSIERILFLITTDDALNLESFKNFSTSILSENQNLSFEINSFENIKTNHILEIYKRNNEWKINILLRGYQSKPSETLSNINKSDFELLRKNLDTFYDVIEIINNEKNQEDEIAKIAGINYGVVGSSNIYSDNVVFQCKRGHGHAAEKANHLHDLFKGENAKHIGSDNAKNGADRFVNGINIQTKYCSSGSKCISECFENGKFRYINMNGSLMQIEVPADLYDDSIKAMENRIRTGQVPGMTDPKLARELIRKGHYTYKQAKNIAEFGNIDSIKYDALNGVIISGTAFGISATISFAYSVWNGEDVELALKKSCLTGLKIGGVTWVSSILTSQVGRTGIEKSLRPATDFMVNKMGSKASAVIANGLRGSGKKIFGKAAMNNVSKLLRGNVVTGTLTIAVLSASDVTRLVRGSISASQAFKNITVTASSVTAGTGGTAGGAIIGSLIFPGAGTVIGGLVGGVVAGSLAGKASKKILDKFIKDDAESMLNIFEQTFSDVAFDFLLSESEINSVTSGFGNMNLPQELKNMYVSDDPKDYSYSLIQPKIIDIIKLRKKIELPSYEEINLTISNLLEEEILQ